MHVQDFYDVSSTIYASALLSFKGNRSFFGFFYNSFFNVFRSSGSEIWLLIVEASDASVFSGDAEFPFT